MLIVKMYLLFVIQTVHDHAKYSIIGLTSFFNNLFMNNNNV